MKTKSCTICKKQFLPKTFAQKFCWFNCANRHERSKAIKIKKKKCYCTKEFEPKTALQKYCSYECAYADESKSTLAEIPDLKKSDNKEFVINKTLIKKKQLEEVGFQFCEHCKTSSSLIRELHHIVFRSEAPKHRAIHNIRNLILLCKKCHLLFHRDPKVRIPYIIERELWFLFPEYIKKDHFITNDK